MDNFKTFFVVNPNSANGRTGKVWPEVKKLAGNVLGDIDFALTEKQGHAADITRQAIKDGYEMIVSLGGDGTNNEVTNGFFEDGKQVNPDAVMAVICSGTGSDFIRTTNIPRDYRKAVTLLAGRDTLATDVGKMVHRDHSGKDVTRYFINIASFGVGGEVDDRVNRTTKVFGGKASFLIGSLRGTLAYTNKPVSIKLDDSEAIERTVFNVAVANGQYFGAGMRTAPEASVDDGLFDVVVLGNFTFTEQLRLSRTIYDGKHVEMEKVESFRAKRVEATSIDDRVLLDVDGEQPGMLPATFEIQPGAIRMKRPGVKS